MIWSRRPHVQCANSSIGLKKQEKLLRLKIYFRLLIWIGFLRKKPAGEFLPRCFPQNWCLEAAAQILDSHRKALWMTGEEQFSFSLVPSLLLQPPTPTADSWPPKIDNLKILNLKSQCYKIASERIVINSMGATEGREPFESPQRLR